MIKMLGGEDNMNQEWKNEAKGLAERLTGVLDCLSGSGVLDKSEEALFANVESYLYKIANS